MADSYTVTLNEEQQSQDNQIPQDRSNIEEIRQQLESNFDEKINQIKEDYETKYQEVEDRAAAKAKEELRKAVLGEEDKEEWVPKSYDEIVDRSVEKMEARREAREKEQAEAEKAKQEELEKSRAEYQKQWDEQIDSLSQMGLIPRLNGEVKADKVIMDKLAKREVLTEEEMKHPHVVARATLLRAAKEAGEYNLKAAYLDNRDKFQQQVEEQQMNAPVFGPGGTTAGEDDSGMPSYEELSNSSIEELTKKYGNVL